jgi:hypothetical protein
MVTKAGAVSVETYVCKGVMVTVPVPVWPAVRVSVFAEVEDGVKLESVTTNEASHCELTSTAAGREVEPMKVVLPA